MMHRASQIIKSSVNSCQTLNCVNKQTTPCLNYISNHIHEHGFVVLSPDFYMSSKLESSTSLLKELQSTFKYLHLDTYSPGNRFRAFTSYRYCPIKEEFIMNESKREYFQTRKNNYIDGGKIRVFEPVETRFLDNPLWRSILKKDIDIVRKTGIVDFDETLEIVINQQRYAPKIDQPSFSTPLWLHRDDEPLVFAHLFNVSPNILGGDSLIASDIRTISKVLKLTSPLETLVVTKKPYHAVTPMGNSNNSDAFRDVVFVNFINRKPRK